MSKVLDLRTAIKTALVDAEVLAAERIVVERQTDVLAMVSQIVAQTGAVALTIAPARGVIVNADSKNPLWAVTLTLTLWTRTVLSLEETPEETVHEAMIAALHHLVIDAVQGGPGFPRQRLEVTEWREVEDPEFLRRDTTVRTRLVL